MDLPRGTPGSWRYVMSIDIGYQDRDAIAVLGWCDAGPDLYVVEEWEENHKDVDQLIAQARGIYDRWRPGTVVGDNGGGGKKVLATIASRWGIPVGDKPTERVLTQIGYVNDELRSGRLKVGPGSHFARDTRLIKWDSGARGREVDDGYHSDIEATIRYALPHCHHFRWAPPPATRSEVDAYTDRVWERTEQADGEWQ